MIKKILIGFMLILSVVSVGCTRSYTETHNVLATVVDKEYTPSSSYTVMVHMGKTAMPQTRHRPAKYEVYLDVDDKGFCLDDEELYSMFDIGEEVKCRLVITYNSKGEFKNSTIIKGWEINE